MTRSWTFFGISGLLQEFGIRRFIIYAQDFHMSIDIWLPRKAYKSAVIRGQLIGIKPALYTVIFHQLKWWQGRTWYGRSKQQLFTMSGPR